MKTSDITGFVGVAILLIAFLLNLLKVVKQTDRSYIILNIAGVGLA